MCRNPERKEKSRLTTKGGSEGVGNQVPLRFVFHATQCDKTFEQYRVLGETKVVIQEFYTLPSYHSCTRAGRKKTCPDLQRLRRCIFYFYFLSAQSCFAEKHPCAQTMEGFPKPLTTDSPWDQCRATYAQLKSIRFF